MKVKGEKQKQEYTPYGEEWEAELMKWRKKDLIELIRTNIKDLQELRGILNEVSMKAKGLERDRKTAENNFTEKLDAILESLKHINANIDQVSITTLSHNERNGVDRINRNLIKNIINYIDLSKNNGVFHDLPF